jgi:hypothetical protein
MPPAPGAGTAPPPVASSGLIPADLAARFEERPELAAGAAFAGGFVLAMILKRLAG